MTATKIQIMTRLHNGIYKSIGGGETRVVAEFAYGPRNLVKAYRQLLRERADNRRYYGNIGCGHSWIETTDGRWLDTGFVFDDGEQSHAELVAELESWLLTPEQQQKNRRTDEREMVEINESIARRFMSKGRCN